MEIKRDPFFADIDWDKLERKELDPPQILDIAAHNSGQNND